MLGFYQFQGYNFPRYQFLEYLRRNIGIAIRGMIMNTNDTGDSVISEK